MKREWSELGKEKEYCQALTCHEEELLVQCIKSKNRVLQSVGRKDLNEFLVQTLKFRVATNKKVRCGHRQNPFSPAAR